VSVVIGQRLVIHYFLAVFVVVSSVNFPSLSVALSLARYLNLNILTKGTNKRLMQQPICRRCLIKHIDCTNTFTI
jgi:hypothetical protein